MSEFQACQSYRPGETICDDGFPIKALCTGRVGCFMCGAISDRNLPLCMSEEAPPHLFTDGGLPRLARNNPTVGRQSLLKDSHND